MFRLWAIGETFLQTAIKSKTFSLVLLVLSICLNSCMCSAGFDSRGWVHVRDILLPPGLPEGPVAVPIESAVIEKCRPDMADLRVATSDGEIVPFTLEEASPIIEPEGFPVNVAGISRNPGQWTEIWVDKSDKIVTNAVMVRSNSGNFVRQVEVKGSDNTRELYVLRMDGLIMRTDRPIPLESLRIDHPLNNFRYLRLQILDENQQPLKIDSILCFPPIPEVGIHRQLPLRVVRNQSDPATGSTTIVVDLGKKRFPVCRVSVSTGAKQFVKNVRVMGASSEASGMPWKKICETTLFRVRKGPAIQERLAMNCSPETSRFLMIELTGGDGPAVAVDSVEALGSVPLVVFDHRLNRDYQLLYGNPRAAPLSVRGAGTQVNVRAVAEASPGLELGEEKKNTPRPKASIPTHSARDAATSPPFRAAVAIPVFLALLVVLILALRALRIRRARRSRPSRLFHVRW